MIQLTILVGVFLGGAACGFLVLLRIGAAQEGRWLRSTPPTRLAAAARRLSCLHVQAIDQSAGRTEPRR